MWTQCADCDNWAHCARLVGTSPSGYVDAFDPRCVGCRHDLRAVLRKIGYTDLVTTNGE